jgi:hypothetical protein
MRTDCKPDHDRVPERNLGVRDLHRVSAILCDVLVNPYARARTLEREIECVGVFAECSTGPSLSFEVRAGETVPSRAEERLHRRAPLLHNRIQLPRPRDPSQRETLRGVRDREAQHGPGTAAAKIVVFPTEVSLPTGLGTELGFATVWALRPAGGLIPILTIGRARLARPVN